MERKIKITKCNVQRATCNVSYLFPVGAADFISIPASANKIFTLFVNVRNCYYHCINEH